MGQLRDRVVIWSQVGKRKLDAVFTRRELDRRLILIGEQILTLVREGRFTVPDELATTVAAARELEERLDRQREDIAALKSEVAGRA